MTLWNILKLLKEEKSDLLNKMEAWFLTTGAMHWQKLFEAQMQAQPFVLPITGPNGEQAQQGFYGMIEPIQLFRFVFPKEAQGKVLKTLQFDQDHGKLGMRLQRAALRKALGLRKLGDEEKNAIPNVRMNVNTDNVSIIPVGIHDDVEKVMKSTGVKQERI